MQIHRSKPERRAQLWRWGLRFVASIAVTILIFTALNQRFDALPTSLAVATWGIPVYTAILLTYGVLRAFRWWFLLRPLDSAVPVKEATLVGLAGTMWIALLPWRLGEFARPLLIARCTQVRASQALGAVAIERVCDGLIICGLFLAIGTTLPARPELAQLTAGTSVFVSFFLVALLGLVAAALWPRMIFGLTRATVGRIAPKLGERMIHLAEGLCEGLRALPNPRPLLGFIACTLIYWTLNAVGMWIFARATGLDLGFYEACAVMAVVNLALLIPGPPAQLGTFHAGILFGLSMFLTPGEVAEGGARYAFYVYGVQLLAIITVGLWAQRKLGIGVVELFTRGRLDEPTAEKHVDTRKLKPFDTTHPGRDA